MIEVRFLKHEKNEFGTPGVWAPVFTCDCCRNRIDDLTQAVYIYDTLDADVTQPIQIAHVGECHHALIQDRARDGAFPGFDRLSALPNRLVQNTRAVL